MRRGALVDRHHPRRQFLAGLGPHQIDIAMLRAQLDRRRRVAAEIQERAAILLIGPRGLRRQPAEIIDLALVIDLVLRPGLFQDLDHLARALVAVGAVFLLTGEIGTDDVDRQPAFQHVVEGGHRARQHDRLHFAAAHRREQVHLRGDRRTAGDKAQRVLPDLIGGRAQDVAKPVRLGAFHNFRTMVPARPQIPLWHAKMAEVIRT